MLEHIQPVIGPYESRPAVCQEYDRRAADVARQIAALIRSHLPQVEVEHVGSTAVHGYAGKGIVDLMILIPEGEMDNVNLLLDRLGFQRQTNRDPFPEDRPMRVGSLVHDGETFLLHVHVIPETSPEVDEMRFFRACLRADPYLVKAYVAKKRRSLPAPVSSLFGIATAPRSNPAKPFSAASIRFRRGRPSGDRPVLGCGSGRTGEC